MKKLCALLLLFPFFVNAQVSGYNLREITSLEVHLRDPHNVLTESNFVKVETETKIKIKNAGIELKFDSPSLTIGLTNLKNYVLVWLRIYEDVTAERNGKKINTHAITYSNDEIISVGLLDNKNLLVVEVVEKLLNTFLNEYLTDNQK